MSWDLEHPDITHANLTGYPRGYDEDERVYCELCGVDITDKEQYYDHRHDHLCAECLLFLHERND